MSKLVEEQTKWEKGKIFSPKIKRGNRKVSTIEGITLDDLGKSEYFIITANINQLVSSTKSQLPYCLNHNKCELGEFTS